MAKKFKNKKRNRYENEFNNKKEIIMAKKIILLALCASFC